MCKLSIKVTSVKTCAVYSFVYIILCSVIIFVPVNTHPVQITSKKLEEQITRRKVELSSNKHMRKENQAIVIASVIQLEESKQIVEELTSKKSKLPSHVSSPFVLVVNEPVNLLAPNTSLAANAFKNNSLLNFSIENRTSYMNKEEKYIENNTSLPVKSKLPYIRLSTTEQLTSKSNIARQNYDVPFFLRPRPVRPLSQLHSKMSHQAKRPVHIARDKKSTICHDKAKCIDTLFGAPNETPNKKTTAKESGNTECPDKAKCVDTVFGSNEGVTTKKSENTECPDKAKCVDTVFGSNEEITTKKSENMQCHDKAKCVDTPFAAHN